MPAEFATGDAAWFAIDGNHSCVMSCQHGRPMGRFAGHNVVCDLLGLPMLPLKIDWYTTILDLGPWGAVCTEGWDRRVATTGGRRQADQRKHQPGAHLSAAIRRSPRDFRRRGADRPGAARLLSLNRLSRPHRDPDLVNVSDEHLQHIDI